MFYHDVHDVWALLHSYLSYTGYSQGLQSFDLSCIPASNTPSSAVLPGKPHPPTYPPHPQTFPVLLANKFVPGLPSYIHIYIYFLSYYRGMKWPGRGSSRSRNNTGQGCLDTSFERAAANSNTECTIALWANTGAKTRMYMYIRAVETNDFTFCVSINSKSYVWEKF